MSRKNKNIHNGGGNGGGGVGMFGGMGFLQTIPEADVESSRGGGDGDSCSVYSMTSRTSQFTQGTTHTSRTPQTSNLSGTTSSSGHAAAGGAPVPYSSMEHPHPNHPPSGSSNGGVGGGVGTSVDTVRNNSLKRWWHVMGTSSNREGGSSRAGSVASSSGFNNEEPVVNGGPIDVDSGARTHYNVTFSAGGGGSVNAVVDASGSVVSELTDQRKTHPDQSVDGSNCGGGGGGGGNGPAVKRSFRDRMKEARRCNRAMAIHGLLCVGIFLAIVVGLSVYFTLDSTKARGGGGGAAISQTVDDDDNVPDVEVGDAEWENGASWPGGIVNAEPTSTPAAQPSTPGEGSSPAQQPTREPQDWKDKDKGEDCKGGDCNGNKPTQEDDDVPTAAPQEQEWTVKTSSPVMSPTPPVPSPTTLPPVVTPPTPPASTPTSANADGGPSYQAVLNVLSSVSSPSLLADPSTPQGFAANWIARGGGNDNAGGNGGAAGERDGLNLELDVGQSNAGWDDRVVSERRYKQRYALAVLHKALAGPRGIGGNGGGVPGAGGGRDRRDRARERNRRLSRVRGPEPGRKKARRRLLDEEQEASKQEVAGAAATTTKNMRGTRNMQITVEFGTHDPDHLPEEGADHVPPVVIEDGQNRQNAEESSRWLSPNDECLWAGITCRSVPAVDPVTGKYTGKYESVVVGVVLDSSDLAGELPEEIGTALTSLQELTLYSNAVTGQIPESLTTLRDLYYLDLGSNRFNGRVPLFGPDLEYLYLNENDLSGPLPSPPLGGGGGGRATTYPPGVPQGGGQGQGGVEEDTSVGGRPYKLKHLWVDRNDLSGEMPEGIARFEALESFIIYGNRVSSTLPETISALSELRYLDVSYNEMFGSLPYALYELSSLDHLYLTSNGFSGSLSSSVERLVNLEYLWMDSNEFAGPVPETLAKLSRLRSLLLQENKISGVVPQLVCGLTTTSGGGTLEFLEADCDASGAFERNEKGRFSDGDEEYYYYVECECCTKCYPEAAADGEEETP